MLEELYRRRSIRKFTTQPVSKEAAEKLLIAGLLAPSSKDSLSTEFVVVENADTIAALASCKDYGAGPLRSATLAVVVVADTRKSDVWVENAAIAAILIQLEAEHLGLGSTWVQIRLRGNDEISAEAKVREVLGLPDYLGVLCVLAIGHKDEQKAPHELTEADWARVRREHF